MSANGRASLLETFAYLGLRFDITRSPVGVSSLFLHPPGCLNHNHERSRWALNFSISELKSVTVKKEGWTFLVFRLKDASTPLPALHFHQGGSTEFLDSLKKFALLME